MRNPPTKLATSHKLSWLLLAVALAIGGVEAEAQTPAAMSPMTAPSPSTLSSQQTAKALKEAHAASRNASQASQEAATASRHAAQAAAALQAPDGKSAPGAGTPAQSASHSNLTLQEPSSPESGKISPGIASESSRRQAESRINKVYAELARVKIESLDADNASRAHLAQTLATSARRALVAHDYIAAQSLADKASVILAAMPKPGASNLPLH